MSVQVPGVVQPAVLHASPHTSRRPSAQSSAWRVGQVVYMRHVQKDYQVCRALQPRATGATGVPHLLLLAHDTRSAVLVQDVRAGAAVNTSRLSYVQTWDSGKKIFRPPT